VIYAKAREMQADSFSKPYEPAKQGPFSKLILGKDINKVNRWVAVRNKREKERAENERLKRCLDLFMRKQSEILDEC
jgi:hypothetical protein